MSAVEREPGPTPRDAESEARALAAAAGRAEALVAPRFRFVDASLPFVGALRAACVDRTARRARWGLPLDGGTGHA